MRELRARRKASVTDQTTGRRLPERKVTSQEATNATTEIEKLQVRAESRCIVCGMAKRFSRRQQPWWWQRT